MNFQPIIDSLTTIVTDIINFIPNLINGLIILLAGLLIARLARWLVGLVLRQLRFDALVERVGVTGSLRGLGIATPLSKILAQTIFALLLLSFLITATRLMGLEAVSRLLEQLLEFLPNIISALIIFVLGGMAAQFAGNVVTAALAANGMSNTERVGRTVQYLISVFVMILALSELGVDTAILVTALTITIAAFGLALGLGLGLGARSVISHILAGFYLRQRYNNGEQLSVGEVQGKLTNIGAVNSVLQGDVDQVVIPNTFLLEALVRTEREPAA